MSRFDVARAAFVSAVLLLPLSACRGSGTPPTAFLPSSVDHRAPAAKAGLGATLTTADNGQIFGFDIDRNGNDGALASTQTVNSNGAVRVSMETFDQNTGAITSAFAKETGTVDSYAFDGIFTGDIGLVTHFVVPKGQLFAKRFYEVMNPVTAQKFTGNWTPPIHDIDVLQAGVNQTSSTAVLLVIELQNQDQPDLVVTNIGANTVSKTIKLDPALFAGGDGPELSQYTAANKAVIALSPDGGTVGGRAPVNAIVDLATGAKSQFNGFNNGPFHAGFVNGAAVDPNTGILATDTELNAQVEFYNVDKKLGVAAVQLPCTGDESQTNSGAGIAVDPVNKLFLVTDPAYACDGSSDGAIVVYDEKGNQVEVIRGFKFAIAEPPPVINPGKRMGWAFGPGFNQLRQFFY